MGDRNRQNMHLAYLGGYTHRVAISNHRLINAADEQATFRWKHYQDESRQKIMILKADEFIRRLLLHVLPHGMQRFRHFGFFGGNTAIILLTHTCETGKMQTIATWLRPPRRKYLNSS